MKKTNNHSSDKTKTTVSSKKTIETIAQENFLDSGLIAYNFLQDAQTAKDKGQVLFFDTSDPMPIPGVAYSGQMSGAGLLKNTRWLTFNIPAIDALSRSNPLVKKAVNYLSSKPLINGIDINSSELESEEIYQVNRYIKNMYSSLKSWLSKGITYGGSGGLLWFRGDDNRDLTQPLIVSKIKKNSFMGVKPLARWYQIEPDLQSPLIQTVDPDRGITDARLVGMPEYYNVSLDGGMVGNPKRSQLKVHVSRLLIYNAEMPSYIETQIERYWGASIVEFAWNDLNIDYRLWRATAKTAEKNNLGVLKIDGLGLAGANMTVSAKNRYAGRMSLIKESSANGVIAIDGKDAFEFASAVMSGYGDILGINNSRLAGSFRVPVSVLFPGEKSDDEDRLYLQSQAELQDIQEFYLRPAYEQLIPCIIKSEIGKSVKDINFMFNPIETQTLKDKADMFKTMADGFETLKRIGVADTSTLIRMLDDINKNPLNISQNMNKDYRKKIVDDAKKGIFYTDMYEKIEIAKTLNQMQQDGDGVGGISSPKSEVGNGGGNPKDSKKPLKRNVLNPDKGKK